MALGTTNISATLVKNTLGESTTTVGGLCTSSKINMLSKHKPVRYAGTDTATNPNWWKTSNNNCGISVAPITSIRDLTAADWVYEKPRGGATEPYRLGDFREYQHINTPDLCSGKQADITVNLLTQTNFVIGQELAADPYTLSATDFSGGLFGDYYFTALIEGSGAEVVHSAPLQVKNGGKTITLPTSLFTSSLFTTNPCSCKVALSYVKQDYSIGMQNSTYMPVYRDVNWKNPFNITFSKDLPIAFNVRAFGRTVGGSNTGWTAVESMTTLDVNQLLSIKFLVYGTSANPVTINLDTLQLKYKSFSGVDVVYKPQYYTGSTGSNVAINGNIVIPASGGGSIELIVSSNLLFRDAAGNAIAPNVANGTIRNTAFTFIPNQNGIAVTSTISPAYNFKYNTSVTP